VYNPNEIKSLWLYPGELALLMEYCGVVLDANAPLAGDPTFSYQEMIREPELVLAEVDRTLKRNELTAYLNTLAHPSALVRVKRGLRRRQVQISYACVGAPDDNIILLATRPDGGAELLFPFDQSSLSQFLCSGMGDILPLEPPMPTFMPLSPAGMSALLALADLFNQEYPIPDPDWLPDVPLIFTRDSWYQLIMDGLQAEPLDSLVAGFQDLCGLQIEPIGMDELDALLLIFCNEGWLGVENEDIFRPITTDAVFYVGKDLAITLRCMAWWDLSLGLEMLTEENPFYAMQASINWQFCFTNGDPQRITTHAIDGETFTQSVMKFIQQGLKADKAKLATQPALRAPAPKSRLVMSAKPPFENPVRAPTPTKKPATAKSPAAPLTPPALAPITSSSKKVCKNCGQLISAEARFCKSCGTPVDAMPTVKNVCPGCGQPVRPGAAFCKNCGEKIE